MLMLQFVTLFEPPPPPFPSAQVRTSALYPTVSPTQASVAAPGVPRGQTATGGGPPTEGGGAAAAPGSGPGLSGCSAAGLALLRRPHGDQSAPGAEAAAAAGLHGRADVGVRRHANPGIPPRVDCQKADGAAACSPHGGRCSTMPAGAFPKWEHCHGGLGSRLPTSFFFWNPPPSPPTQWGNPTPPSSRGGVPPQKANTYVHPGVPTGILTQPLSHTHTHTPQCLVTTTHTHTHTHTHPSAL